MAAIEPMFLRIDEAGASEHSWKLDVIRPIIAHPKGSSERRARLRQLVGTRPADWTGKPRALTEATLDLWVRTFENSGCLHLCLAKKARKDKGKPRVFIRREWDHDVSLDAATCDAVRHELKQYMRGLIKGGAQRKIAMILAGEKLRDLTKAYGGDPSAISSDAFVIPLDFYRNEMHFKAVYRHKHDRKTSEDNKPRIRRTTERLEPMEVVVTDVHHINVLVRRENGTAATPKLIAFHDIATNRVFCEIIMFEEKGGVRNADVITAFLRMCQHPAFGVPRTLYADNGAEFGFADALSDALKLNCRIVAFNGPEDRGRVIRAKAYNASAKHVEGLFRQLNQQYIRHVPGYIGDDRMNPKRPALGKLPAPFSEGFDAFCERLYDLLTAYEHMPQKGALKDMSPAATFRRHVEAGWTATLMDTDDLLTVFTKQEARTVQKHGIHVGTQFWTCDGLMAHFGERVMVHIPKYHGFSRLLVTDGKGNHIGLAEADKPFEVLDQRGAKESARRSSIRNRALADLDRSAPDIDVGAELAGFGRSQKPVKPNNPDALISVNRRGGMGLALPPTKQEKGPTRQEIHDEARKVDEARSALASAYARKVS